MDGKRLTLVDESDSSKQLRHSHHHHQKHRHGGGRVGRIRYRQIDMKNEDRPRLNDVDYDIVATGYDNDGELVMTLVKVSPEERIRRQREDAVNRTGFEGAPHYLKPEKSQEDDDDVDTMVVDVPEARPSPAAFAPTQATLQEEKKVIVVDEEGRYVCIADLKTGVIHTHKVAVFPKAFLDEHKQDIILAIEKGNTQKEENKTGVVTMTTPPPAGPMIEPLSPMDAQLVPASSRSLFPKNTVSSQRSAYNIASLMIDQLKGFQSLDTAPAVHTNQPVPSVPSNDYSHYEYDRMLGRYENMDLMNYEENQDSNTEYFHSDAHGFGGGGGRGFGGGGGGRSFGGGGGGYRGFSVGGGGGFRRIGGPGPSLRGGFYPRGYYGYRRGFGYPGYRYYPYLYNPVLPWLLMPLYASLWYPSGQNNYYMVNDYGGANNASMSNSRLPVLPSISVDPRLNSDMQQQQISEQLRNVRAEYRDFRQQTGFEIVPHFDNGNPNTARFIWVATKS